MLGLPLVIVSFRCYNFLFVKEMVDSYLPFSLSIYGFHSCVGDMLTPAGLFEFAVVFTACCCIKFFHNRASMFGGSSRDPSPKAGFVFSCCLQKCFYFGNVVI